VTHDQEEAFAFADRIVVINQGRVEQVGTPLAIMDEPRSEFVAGFVGEVNAIDAIVRIGAATAGALRVAADGLADGDRVRLVIRAYDIKMWDDPSGIATVERMLTLSDRVKIDARVDGAGLVSAHFPFRSSLLRTSRRGGGWPWMWYTRGRAAPSRPVASRRSGPSIGAWLPKRPDWASAPEPARARCLPSA
jgi:ABC-type sugar transport system ATPase subunit